MAMQAQPEIDWTTIIMAVIGLIGATLAPIMTVLVVYLTKLVNRTNEAKAAAEQANVLAASTEAKVDKVITTTDQVKIEVNSKASALMAELDKLRTDYLRISTEKATLEEHARGKATAAEVKEATRPQSVVASPSPATGQPLEIKVEEQKLDVKGNT